MWEIGRQLDIVAGADPKIFEIRSKLKSSGVEYHHVGLL